MPFLVIAVAVLFAAPERSGELFAWPIAPPMTAYLLASAYVGGIAYFVAVWRERRWHRVRHGLPAVLVFAGTLLVTTLLHLGRFSQNLPFAVWLTLYATTPIAMVALLVLQGGADPRCARAPPRSWHPPGSRSCGHGSSRRSRRARPAPC